MKKITALLLAVLLGLTVVAGCGGGSNTPAQSSGSAESQSQAQPASDDGMIRVWVGEESAEFYQKACDEYVAAHPEFGYKIEVKGMDTGSIAGTVSPSAGFSGPPPNMISWQLVPRIRAAIGPNFCSS